MFIQFLPVYSQQSLSDYSYGSLLHFGTIIHIISKKIHIALSSHSTKVPWPSVHGVSQPTAPDAGIRSSIPVTLHRTRGLEDEWMYGEFANASSKVANGLLSKIGILTIPIHICKSPALKFSLLLRKNLVITHSSYRTHSSFCAWGSKTNQQEQYQSEIINGGRELCWLCVWVISFPKTRGRVVKTWLESKRGLWFILVGLVA